MKENGRLEKMERTRKVMEKRQFFEKLGENRKEIHKPDKKKSQTTEGERENYEGRGENLELKTGTVTRNEDPGNLNLKGERKCHQNQYIENDSILLKTGNNVKEIKPITNHLNCRPATSLPALDFGQGGKPGDIGGTLTPSTRRSGNFGGGGRIVAKEKTTGISEGRGEMSADCLSAIELLVRQGFSK